MVMCMIKLIATVLITERKLCVTIQYVHIDSRKADFQQTRKQMLAYISCTAEIQFDTGDS